MLDLIQRITIWAAVMAMYTLATAEAGGYAGGSIGTAVLDDGAQTSKAGGSATLGAGYVFNPYAALGGKIMATDNELSTGERVTSTSAFLDVTLSTDRGNRAFVYGVGSLGYAQGEDDFDNSANGPAYGAELGIMVNAGALSGNNFAIGPFMRWTRFYLSNNLVDLDVDAFMFGLTLGWNGY